MREKKSGFVSDLGWKKMHANTQPDQIHLSHTGSTEHPNNMKNKISLNLFVWT
jgi:hypothetical protein